MSPKRPQEAQNEPQEGPGGPKELQESQMSPRRSQEAQNLCQEALRKAMRRKLRKAPEAPKGPLSEKGFSTIYAKS